MKFPHPLLHGKLVKRYKRFMADVVLDSGETVVAHCANSGSMLSVRDADAEVWLSPAQNPDRKLKFTWELIKVGEALVGINTALPNKLVEEAILDGTISELGGYDNLKREVKYGVNSRIDILLSNDDGSKCYVEVKNVTMRRDLTEGAPAEFPDGVTARGAKHLVELSDMVREGHRAVMVYLIQRNDCEQFTFADDIDPTYAETLKEAIKAGVEVLGYTCHLDPEEVRVTRRIEAILPS